jgi:hypothetical protein
MLLGRRLPIRIRFLYDHLQYESDIPCVPVEVSVAAYPVVRAQQSVLTLSANSCPTQAISERQVNTVSGHS